MTEIKKVLSIDGTVIYETTFVNNKKHGVEKTFFHDSGNRRSEHSYINGIRNGFSINYKEDSSIWFMRTFKSGQRHGPAISFTYNYYSKY